MSTLDILDYLDPFESEFMTASRYNHHQIATREIVISPKYWTDHQDVLDDLKSKRWVEVRFRDLKSHFKSKSSLGKKTGVYLFLIRPEKHLETLPSFVYYVGIAGENSSRRPLRTRLPEYHNVSQIKKRSKVERALHCYHRVTYVRYLELDKQPEELKAIERQLHGFFMPFAGSRDFPVELKETMNAF